MSAQRLEIAAAKAALGRILADELIEAAAGALEDGWDSPALRVLAGLSSATSYEATAVFDRALSELDVPRPSKRAAVMRLARDAAERIANNTTAPYEGAKEIWQLSLLLPDEPWTELDSFVYAACEWEDRPEDRRDFEDGIVVAARELLRPR